MTADVDRRGQSRNVCGCSFNVDRERGGIPAEALRTDTQSVNTFQKLFFHIRIKRVGIAFGNGAAKRLFGEICAVFKIPAEAHADNHRRAGVSACILHNLQNKVYQIFFADGVNIFIWLMFSLPKPLGAAVMRILSPPTMRVCMTAGVLSSVLTRISGSRTTDLRKSPSV